MDANRPTFAALKELQDFIIPLTDDEMMNLEKSLLAEGCRDPVVLWKRREDELIIVDGHHRYKICQAHQIAFAYKIITFDDLEHVKLWMVDNQIGRRNLTRDQVSYYRGLKYLSLKKRKGGFGSVKAKGRVEDSTSIVLAKEFRVSASTIKRDSKFAEGLTIIGESNQQLKLKILTGQLRIKKTQVEALSETENPQQFVTELLARHEPKAHKPRFPEDGKDRIPQLRGMILSTVRRLITDRKPEDMAKLRILIDKLEKELFKAERSPRHQTRVDV